MTNTYLDRLAESSPLRWHYGPAGERNAGSMYCYDCDAEVYGFKEGLICSGCGRSEDCPAEPES